MGDGKVRRIAVILNGDTEDRHRENVDRAAQLLKEKGYDIYVASPSMPQMAPTVLVSPDKAGVQKLIGDLSSMLDDDDELVIYTTGHGDKKGDGCLVMKDACVAQGDPIFKRLFALPYAKRTVVMSQCYGGNWARLFAKDPTTLFISAGSKDQTVCCQQFDPLLFRRDSDIPDKNGDGTISWRERFMSLAAKPQAANPAFLAGAHYEDKGIRGEKEEPPPFEPRVLEVKSLEEYKKLIKNLRLGDVAVVDFSAPWCGPCQAYRPEFERLARQAGGRALFISIPNADEEQWREMGVRSFPTIQLVVGGVGSSIVQNRSDPLRELWDAKAAWSDRQYVLAMARRHSEALANAAPELLRDRNFIMAAVERDERALEFAAPELKKDRDFVLAAVKLNGGALEYVMPEFKRDRDVVMAAVKGHGWALRLAAPEFKKDREIVLAAVRDTSWALEYAAPELTRDRDIVLAAVKRNGRALEHAAPEFKKDREIVLAAVMENGMALNYAAPEFKRDRKIVLAAVRKDADVLKCVVPRFANDREVILAAVMADGMALEWVPLKFSRDRKIVLAAVRENGSALEYAAPELKKDREIVLAAVQQTSRALEYAAPGLKKDPKIVLAAAEERRKSLEFAATRSKKDRKIALAGMKLNAWALEDMARELEGDREVVLDLSFQRSTE
jgi:thiol-disulfide isomerase/thioredoxin